MLTRCSKELSLPSAPGLRTVCSRVRPSSGRIQPLPDTLRSACSAAFAPHGPYSAPASGLPLSRASAGWLPCWGIQNRRRHRRAYPHGRGWHQAGQHIHFGSAASRGRRKEVQERKGSHGVCRHRVQSRGEDGDACPVPVVYLGRSAGDQGRSGVLLFRDDAFASFSRCFRALARRAGMPQGFVIIQVRIIALLDPGLGSTFVPRCRCAFAAVVPGLGLVRRTCGAPSAYAAGIRCVTLTMIRGD